MFGMEAVPVSEINALRQMGRTSSESAWAVVLGLGAGWHEPEYRGFGIPFDHRFSRFAEAYQVIRDLLTTDEASLDGEYYQIEDALLFPKPANPDGIASLHIRWRFLPQSPRRFPWTPSVPGCRIQPGCGGNVPAWVCLWE